MHKTYLRAATALGPSLQLQVVTVAQKTELLWCFRHSRCTGNTQPVLVEAQCIRNVPQFPQSWSLIYFSRTWCREFLSAVHRRGGNGFPITNDFSVALRRCNFLPVCLFYILLIPSSSNQYSSDLVQQLCFSSALHRGVRRMNGGG